MLSMLTMASWLTEQDDGHASKGHLGELCKPGLHEQGIMVEAQKEAAAQSREAAAAAARAEAQRLSQQQMQLDIQQRVIQQHQQLGQLQEQNQVDNPCPTPLSPPVSLHWLPEGYLALKRTEGQKDDSSCHFKGGSFCRYSS